MEESAEWLSYGCKLVKHLEESLPNLVNQPDILLSSCDNIIRVFSMCKEMLLSSRQPLENIQIPAQPRRDLQQQQQQQQHLDHEQEWPRTGRTANSDGEPVDMLNAEVLLNDWCMDNVKMDGFPLQSDLVDSSSPPRRERREDECDNIVRRVPASHSHRHLPPEDGYAWRKYGQKEIMRYTYPRSYYRCADHKLYQCPAKKQVQRMNHDPYMFEVTYRGTHTCHVSSATPSAAVALPEQSPPVTIASVHQSLSTKLFHQLGGLSAARSSSSAFASHQPFPGYHLPVADMADAMFNSGSTSSNSMDLIFPSMDDDKWGSDEKKE